MWALVRRLRESGVTIILTTHYIDEAEEMADRIGIINKGELIVVEEKAKLMQKLGKRQLTLNLQEPMAALPATLGGWPLALKAGGNQLEYTFDAHDGAGTALGAQGGMASPRDIPTLLRRLGELGIAFKDLSTHQSSLEEIFVNLLHDQDTEARS
jgi:ABC-2 type transport system ATP-binding protein